MGNNLLIRAPGRHQYLIRAPGQNEALHPGASPPFLSGAGDEVPEFSLDPTKTAEPVDAVHPDVRVITKLPSTKAEWFRFCMSDLGWGYQEGRHQFPIS